MKITRNAKNMLSSAQIYHAGSSQQQRGLAALQPTYAPINEHTEAHNIVFARAYATLLKYYDLQLNSGRDWQVFFDQDIAASLAVIATEDIAVFKYNIKTYFLFFNTVTNSSDEIQARKKGGELFSYLGSLAQQLDHLNNTLLEQNPLREIIKNLIKSQLAPMMRRLISFYKYGRDKNYIDNSNPELTIMGNETVTFDEIINIGLSNDWIVPIKDNVIESNWMDYCAKIKFDATPYGNSNIFQGLRCLVTHGLFMQIYEQFLKAYARVINEAKQALEINLSSAQHAPHYALFLTFLKLMEYLREQSNTLTQRHLDYYYRDILQLREKPSQAIHAHLIIELAKNVPNHTLLAGTKFKAGKDTAGKDIIFASEEDFVANSANVQALMTLYRSDIYSAEYPHEQYYISPIANSLDGKGGVLNESDQAWHPFHPKLNEYTTLRESTFATIGFAIASNYLDLASGTRTINIEFLVDTLLPKYESIKNKKFVANDISCRLSTNTSWLEKSSIIWTLIGNYLSFSIVINSDDPAIAAYDQKIHGYDLSTVLPVVMFTLKRNVETSALHKLLQEIQILSCKINVGVVGHSQLNVTNDFGPINTANPFLIFGSHPVKGSNCYASANEVLNKKLTGNLTLNIEWVNLPNYFPIRDGIPQIQFQYVKSSQRQSNVEIVDFPTDKNNLFTNIEISQDAINEKLVLSNSSCQESFKLKLSQDWGLVESQLALSSALVRKKTPPSKIILPTVQSISLDYNAEQYISLLNGVADKNIQLFQIAPFGHVEIKPTNTIDRIGLLPRFDLKVDMQTLASAAEFYIGISNVQLPQKISLLIQIAEGTAAPLMIKPHQHVQWSYIKENNWEEFKSYEIIDRTGGLTHSDIITFSVPNLTTEHSTLMPDGLYWIKAAIHSHAAAVCEIIDIKSQALPVVLVSQDHPSELLNSPFPANKIEKLVESDAAIKSVKQPFAGFAGRGVEESNSFYIRTSERLRHKDRAITQWDYEHLILESFPQINHVICLNHVRYEPMINGNFIYDELAPGHVTIVTIPNLTAHHISNQLKPYTSISLINSIKCFIQSKLPNYITLHVSNPQYEELAVDFKVKLLAGYDEGSVIKQLKIVITQLLSPWIIPGGTPPVFSGKIYKSHLIKVIEEQPYVDYISNFKLFHNKKLIKQDVVVATSAVSILISAPTERHNINPIHSDDNAAFNN